MEKTRNRRILFEGHVCNSIKPMEAKVQPFINQYSVINKNLSCITGFEFLTSVTTFIFIDHNKKPRLLTLKSEAFADMTPNSLSTDNGRKLTL